MNGCDPLHGFQDLPEPAGVGRAGRVTGATLPGA